MSKELLILSVVIIGVIGIFSSAWWYSNKLSDENAKTDAQNILNFRNTDHSCSELKRLFLAYELKQYNSINDHTWYWEVRDRFIDTGCIGRTQLDNLEFIKMCMDSHITGCEISKLKYPESYENFNFRDAVNNVNSTQWQKLGER